MPRLLAIDTSTEACSVALIDEGNVFEQFIDAPREHVQRLLPMIDALLAERQLSLRSLDGIAFGRGPGSFTGLRICIGVVQGLAFGADIPVVPVSTLAALAQSFVTDTIDDGSYIAATIDARMDEIYGGWFRVGADRLVHAASDEVVCAPEQMPQIDTRNSTKYAVGSGWRYQSRIPCADFASIDLAKLPHAGAIALLGAKMWAEGVRVAAEDVQPVYLRNEVAWKKENQTS
jgi:tRNA threonylcarbamoyladenosine biosynthesis protein TsaB